MATLKRRLEALEGRKNPKLDKSQLENAVRWLEHGYVVLSDDGVAIDEHPYGAETGQAAQWLNTLPVETRRNLFEEHRPRNEKDADKLPDELVLNIACHALEHHGIMYVQPDGTFVVGTTNPYYSPRYWCRIAERAQVLCKERDTVLFPCAPDEMRQCIEYINAGVFNVHPRHPHSWNGQGSCIGIDYKQAGTPYNSPESRALYELHGRVTDALETVRRQLQVGLWETTEEVIEVLEWGIADSEDEPCESVNDSSG